jgi:GNAT superfamily N-acetyltransferase
MRFATRRIFRADAIRAGGYSSRIQPSDEQRLAARCSARHTVSAHCPSPGKRKSFLRYFSPFSTFLGQRGLWLEDLFVYPQHRGKGLGRRFLAELAAVARDRGCGRFEWAVLDWNAPAIRFYERMGATLLMDWRIVRVTGDALARFGRDVSV